MHQFKYFKDKSAVRSFALGNFGLKDEATLIKIPYVIATLKIKHLINTTSEPYVHIPTLES